MKHNVSLSALLALLCAFVSGDTVLHGGGLREVRRLSQPGAGRERSVLGPPLSTTTCSNRWAERRLCLPRPRARQPRSCWRRHAGCDSRERSTRQKSPAVTALALQPQGTLERRVRLELGVLFTQYDTPALTDEMRARARSENCSTERPIPGKQYIECETGGWV